jgi:DNA polymerase III epsilon subunit-like protein
MSKKKSVAVSIDTETTGLDVHNSRIIEIACVPLRPSFEVDETIEPFIRLVNPGKEFLYAEGVEVAFKVNKLNREQIMAEGISYEECKHQFIGWLSSFADNCDPMGQNWMFDAGMIRTMFGHADYEKYFSRKVRDPKILAQYINDARPGTFENTSLDRIAKALGIKFEGDSHRAYNDAVVTAKVYAGLQRRMGLSNWSLDDTKPEVPQQEGK